MIIKSLLNPVIQTPMGAIVPCGTAPRVDFTTKAVTGIPAPENCTLYLVSALVFQHTSRKDVCMLCANHTDRDSDGRATLYRALLAKDGTVIKFPHL